MMTNCENCELKIIAFQMNVYTTKNNHQTKQKSFYSGSTDNKHTSTSSCR